MIGNKTCVVGDINVTGDYEIFFEDQRGKLIPRMENIDIPIPKEEIEYIEIPKVECNRKRFHIGKFRIW